MLSLSINGSILFILLMMGIQDFKYRAISWYAFPVLGFLLLISNKDFTVVEAAVNVGLILFNFFLVTLFFSFRDHRLINVMESYLGLGDILLLFCLAVYFPVALFFLFYLVSLVLITICSGIYIKYNRPKNFTIPLAGLQSLMLIPVLGIVWLGNIQLKDLNENLILCLL